MTKRNGLRFNFRAWGLDLRFGFSLGFNAQGFSFTFGVLGLEFGILEFEFQILGFKFMFYRLRFEFGV